MAAAAKTVAEVNNILGGTGAVTLSEALAALGAATGLTVLTKKIGLWPKLSPVERAEIEALDKDMPEGWFRRMKDLMGTTLFPSAKKVHWRRGSWSIGTGANGDLELTTPVYNEETGTLS